MERNGGNREVMPRKRDREREKYEAMRVVEEAGGGVAEGFEQSEDQLRRQAENVEEGRNPKYDAGQPEAGPPQGTYGEADSAHSAERHDDDR